MRTIYKHTFKIIVLSEYAHYNTTNLEDISYNIKDGEDVGSVSLVRTIPLRSKAAAAACYNLGSDPEFFGMDDDGKDLDGEEDEDVDDA